MENVDYRGATKKFLLYDVLYLMNWGTFIKDNFHKVENKHGKYIIQTSDIQHISIYDGRRHFREKSYLNIQQIVHLWQKETFKRKKLLKWPQLKSKFTDNMSFSALFMKF